MSYQLLSKTEPKARKAYTCIWCAEKVVKGEKHFHVVGKYCGELQDHRWHPECWAAQETYFLESGEEEFAPHEFKRGSLEQG